MQLTNLITKDQLRSVGIGLTEAEAHELIGSLEDILAGNPDRHEHISSADYQTEITVWLAK